MSVLFKNARILKFNDRTFEILNDANLIVFKDIIKKIFTKESKDYKKLVSANYTRIINCKNNLLMPTFKNCHTHSPMTHMRSVGDDLPLQKWLFDSCFPREALLTDEDVYWCTYIAIMEYVSGGVGLSADMYAHKDAYVSAFKNAGLRLVVSNDFDRRNEDPNQVEDEFIKYNNLKGKNADLICSRMGVHSEYLTDESQIKQIADIVHKYKQPFYMHICETELEVKECKDRHGVSPVVYFDSYGLLDYGGGGYHSVWLDENDMDIYKKRNFYAVLNLSSNVKLASGIVKLPQLLKKRVNVAMGTDGASSNNALNMFKEMFLASTLPKLASEDKNLSSYRAEDILQIATINGAHCFNLNDIDTIEEGKKADIIMIDMNMPNMQPENNIIPNIVYSGSVANVKLTMVNGKILYENGKYFIGEEPADIYKKAEYYKKKLIAKL